MHNSKEYRQDPLYRAIKMTEEVRYIEGRFKDLYDKLKNINNLGILPEIYEMARYPKYEHHLGTFYQITQFLDYNEIDDKYLVPLKISTLFLHTGHMPFTYSTERAFFIAANLEKNDNNINNYLNQKLDYIFDNTNFGEDKIKQHKAKLFSLENYRQIYKYFSCYEFLQKWNIIKDKFNLEQKDKEIIIGNIINEKSDGYKYIELADKADFVQRDALYLGTVRLDISPKHLYRQYNINNKNSSFFTINEEGLINNNLNYLEERFYENIEIDWFRSLYEKIVASLILSHNFDFRYLTAFNDNQFKHLITENIETPNMDNANLPPLWVERAKKLFKGKIKFSMLFEIEDLFYKRKNIFDLEYELLEKRKSKRGLLNYPFEKGLLLDIKFTNKDKLPFRSDYKSFKLNVYIDNENRNFKPIIKLIRQISQYCSINDILKIRMGLTNRFSWTNYSRINNNIIDILADSISNIENNTSDEYKQGEFVQKFLKSLTSKKTFEDLWNNFYNHVFWFANIYNNIKNEQVDLRNLYREFAKGITALPIKLLQFKSNKKFINKIYENLEKRIKNNELSSDKKGYIFETLCYLKRLKSEDSKFKFFINNMIIVNPKNENDDNEFDIIELKIKNSKPECWIYACTIDIDNCERNNKDQLEKLSKNINDQYPNLKIRTRYIIPENKTTNNWTPKTQQTGVGNWN